MDRRVRVTCYLAGREIATYELTVPGTLDDAHVRPVTVQDVQQEAIANLFVERKIVPGDEDKVRFSITGL